MKRLLGDLRHRRVYDMKLIGSNLRRLRENRNLSVENVREYLGLGSVQAIYKYEVGKNFPQADILLALLELYDADFMDLICEDLFYCNVLREGDWVLFVTVENHPEMWLEMTVA